MSQNWPGEPQQPRYPQGYPQQQGYPQGQFPQQYPQAYSPYQMPQVHPMAYATAQLEGLGWHFSRAGMMLIITGILMGLCGLGCLGMAAMPLEQIMNEAQMDPEVRAMMTPAMLKLALYFTGGASLIYALLAIILGIFVRKQSKGATITAIVITSLVIAYLLVNMIVGMFQVSKLGPQGMMGQCVIIVPLVICVWQLVWLISALRSARPLAAMQGQMQMQYWQMMQMQQAQQQQYQQMMAQQQGQAAGPQNSEVRSQKSESEKKEGGQ